MNLAEPRGGAPLGASFGFLVCLFICKKKEKKQLFECWESARPIQVKVGCQEASGRVEEKPEGSSLPGKETREFGNSVLKESGMSAAL